MASVPFSILYRIVGSVTRIADEERFAKMTFQYPLSDRGLCNQLTEILYNTIRETFSILYRIVGSVTSPYPTFLPHHQTFSILYRIVGSVTSRGRAAWCTRCALSVSSIGSWAL